MAEGDRGTGGGAPAVRIDEALAIRETVTFHGAGPEKLMGTTHAPLAGAAAGVVICPSICMDFLRNYRREVVLARQIASGGVAVHRFHYRGTGNSDGDSSLTTWQTMIEDALAAAEHVRQEHAVDRIAFVGTRFGAPIAAGAARHHPGAPLVVADPTLDPHKFFKEGFRSRMARELKEQKAAVTTTELLAQLEATGSVDVLGCSVDRPLYESSSGRSLTDELGTDPRPLLLLQLGEATELRPDYIRFLTAAEQAGFEVEQRIVGTSTAWWFLDDDEVPTDDLARGAADWLLSQLTSQAAAAR